MLNKSWRKTFIVIMLLLAAGLYPAVASAAAPTAAAGSAEAPAGNPPAKKGQTAGNDVSRAADRLQPLSPEEQQQVLSRIRQKFRRPELLQGHFTQTTTFADSTDTQVASGRIWLQGPDKMRWEYAEPEKQILVTDGRTIWYYTPDLNQVMTGSVKEMKEARIIVNLLSRLDSKVEGYDLKTARTGRRLVLSLVPRKGAEAPPFEKLEVYFSEPGLQLTETRLVDLFANRIAITYRWDGPPGKPRPKAFFMFVPPKGCDVMPLGQ